MPISLFIQMKLLTIESDQAIVCVRAHACEHVCVWARARMDGRGSLE